MLGGRLNEEDRLTLESIMPENGVIFSDGVEMDFVDFNSGTITDILVSQERAHLVTGS